MGDYLWDKSGEPDEEIARLEQTLGALRHKRQPPALPLQTLAQTQAAAHPIAARRRFSPYLAAAAALLFLLLAGGAWLVLQRDNRQQNTDKQIVNVQPAASPERKAGPVAPSPVKQNDEKGNGVEREQEQAIVSKPAKSQPESKASPRSSKRAPRGLSNSMSAGVLASAPRDSELEREGQQAKAQLILALHIARDKLNDAQKKVQSNKSAGPVS